MMLCHSVRDSALPVPLRLLSGADEWRAGLGFDGDIPRRKRQTTCHGVL